MKRGPNFVILIIPDTHLRSPALKMRKLTKCRSARIRSLISPQTPTPPKHPNSSNNRTPVNQTLTRKQKADNKQHHALGTRAVGTFGDTVKRCPPEGCSNRSYSNIDTQNHQDRTESAHLHLHARCLFHLPAI